MAGRAGAFAVLALATAAPAADSGGAAGLAKALAG